MSHGFDLVVFDLGGVLIRTAASWEEAHRLAGLPGAPPTDPAIRAEVAELADRADGSLSAAELFERIAAASGGCYRVDDVRRISDAWLLGEYPDLASVFDALDEAHVETAVLSNTNEAHWARLAPNSGQPEFPSVLRARHRFASHLLGLVKPDPAIYRALERATGHRPSRILFFDDLEANVRGARAADWTAERVDPAADTASQILTALERYRLIPQTR